MKITAAHHKRLQEVGRALSETDAPLIIGGGVPALLNNLKGRHVILDTHIPWAENEAEDGFSSAQEGTMNMRTCATAP